jgi:NAD-dependent SIR2 family protein deacetylase
MTAANSSSSPSSPSSSFAACAEWIAACSGLLITAGAGMGIDSGLPDFRGTEGLWRAYPPLRATGLRFEEIANPRAFADDPGLAWGFYGHRLQQYRAARPHRGFHILQEIAAKLPDGAFVVTSNVDGQFQKAGFAPERVYEIHGSIHRLQCERPCSPLIWPADDFAPTVDTRLCRLSSPLPTCIECGGLARPNILMFDDWGWAPGNSEAQRARFDAWLDKARNPLVIELGAGTVIPSIRLMGERSGMPLIRINPREADVSGSKRIALPTGALDALEGIRTTLARRGFLAA